jgi:ribonuclease P protein subunit RPR2
MARIARREKSAPRADSPPSKRFYELVALAFDMLPADAALARRYVKLAHTLALRHRLKPGFAPKHAYCKKCFTPLLPGATATVRANPKNKTTGWTCRHCGTLKRFGYHANLKRVRGSAAPRKSAK